MSSLPTLPFELAVGIAETLCLYCTPPPSCNCGRGCIAIAPDCWCSTPMVGASHFLPEAKARIRGLSALCLTSRRLRDAATRHLYHHPDTSKWWLLARTLLREPDLAQHVKVLSFPKSCDHAANESAVAPDVASYYAAHLAGFAGSLPAEEACGFLDLVRDNGGLAGKNTTNHNTAVSLITGLCPGVETLEAVLIPNGGLPFCFPASVPSLHTVELAYNAAEGGMHLQSLVPLFKAAPNLSVMRLHSANDEADFEPGMTFEKLKTVELENSAVSSDALSALLNACPALETFRYEAGGALSGSLQFNPDEARTLLMAHDGRLKKVTLEMEFGHEGWDFAGNEWDEWQEEEKYEILAAFAKRGIDFHLDLL